MLTCRWDGSSTFLSEALGTAMRIAKYDTSLTDAQWALIKPLLPKPKKRGRPPTDRRHILEAMLYILKSGIHWRLLPEGFPPWQTVYHAFGHGSLQGIWERLNARLRTQGRAQEGKRNHPTAAPIVKALNPTRTAGRWATTQPNASRGASAICWLTHWVCSWALKTPQPMCRNDKEPKGCWVVFVGTVMKRAWAPGKSISSIG